MMKGLSGLLTVLGIAMIGHDVVFNQISGLWLMGIVMLVTSGVVWVTAYLAAGMGGADQATQDETSEVHEELEQVPA